MMDLQNWKNSFTWIGFSDIPGIITRQADIGPIYNNDGAILLHTSQQKNDDRAQLYVINSRALNRRNRKQYDSPYELFHHAQ